MNFTQINTAELQVDNITQTVVTVSNVSVTVLAANAERKYIYFLNQGTVNAPVYLHFDASAATNANGIALRDGQSYSFPSKFVYTGEVRAISDTSANKPLYVEEWF